MEERPFEHLQKPLQSGGLFDDEPDYLEYNYRGRPYHEKLFFNAGGLCLEDPREDLRLIYRLATEIYRAHVRGSDHI